MPHQIIQIELAREHRQRSIRLARPFRLEAIPVQLDTVLVGIAQVQRFADAVVAGAVELNARREHTMQRIGQRRAGRIQNRGVKQAGGAGRRRMAAFALPGIQSDVVVITARRNECRLIAVALHDLEAEHAAVKSQCAVEIGDFQVDMSDAGAGDDGGVRHDRSCITFVMAGHVPAIHVILA